MCCVLQLFTTGKCVVCNITKGMHLVLQVLGSRGDRERQIEKDTDEKIKSIERNVQKNKQEALSKLLEMVYDINPELHENLRL